MSRAHAPRLDQPLLTRDAYNTRVNVREEYRSGRVNPRRAACREGSWGLRPTLIQTAGQGGWGWRAAADVAL